MSASSDDQPPRSEQIDEVCRRFEAAWQGGEPPSITGYVAAGDCDPNEPEPNRELLCALVAIDMEFRWRPASRESSSESTVDFKAGGLPLRPRLADYVSRYPTLDSLKLLPAELIAQEYYVRHRWGDRPSAEEYLAAFGQEHPGLREALEEADQELRGEETESWDQGPPDADDERQLVAEAVAGQRDALERLLLRHYDSLYVEVASMLRDAGTHNTRVGEVLQMVHTRAFQLIETFQAKADYAFRAWLSALAADLVEVMLKREKKADQDGSGSMEGVEPG